MRRIWATTFLWSCWLACCAQPVGAEEPFRQFLQGLKNEGLYDLASFYLEQLQSDAHVDPQFLQEIPLERANLLQESAATMAARSPGRTKRLDQAEQAFEAFLAAHKEHPRRSEARVGLGNLLLARAEELKEGSDPKVANPAAAKFYDDARKVFASTQDELKTILEQMQGARIDPADLAKKELRDKLRGDYRRAELLAAFATEQVGRCHPNDSETFKKELDAAQQAYSKFYTNEKDRQEARNIALFYRSGIQRDFGKVNDAADGYMRILGIDGIDELRPLQFKSLTELIRLWSAFGEEKLAATMDLVSRWEKLIRPDEKGTQDVIDFQVVAAKAKLNYAQFLQNKDKHDRNIARLRKDVRDELRRLAAIAGPHQTTAREMMVGLGMGRESSSTPVELPKVTSYEQAIKEAELRFDSLQTEVVTQQTLQESLDAADDQSRQQEIAAQLASTNEAVARLQEQIAELYMIALRMFPQGGELNDVNQARYRLAYIQLQRGDPWSAISIGQFLAEQLAGTPTGLQAATIALAGYRDLISSAELTRQADVASQLQPFAEFMVTTWPESTQAQAAAATLVQLAMSTGDTAKARSYLDQLPGGSARTGGLRRDIGTRLAQEYFQQRIKVEADSDQSAELLSKRDSALQMLSEGLNGIAPNEIDARAIEAINALVRLYLAIGDLDKATPWMTDPQKRPINLIKARPDLVSERLTKLDSYRTALQFMVSQLAAGSQVSESATTEITELIAQMKEAAGEDAEGAKLLIAIFVSIARDLQDLVEGAKPPAVKQKLAESMILLCKQVAANSNDFNTRYWAGSTLSGVAGKLDASSQKTKQELQREAAALLESILTKEEQSPGWIDTPNGELSVRVALAQGLRHAGQYQQAIDQLGKVLTQKDKENMLGLQITAAEILQAWGDAGKSEQYELAINGLPANKIWGWKRMSSLLERELKRNPAVSEPFFQARLGVSQCLFKHALVNSSRKTELLELAAREINTTRFLHKDLGGPEQYKKFDALMKSIQKELGQQPVGLTVSKKE